MDNDLEVPDESYEALGEIVSSAHPRADEFVRNIAAPVVAAELHRLAGSGWARPADLIARAEELEAQ